MKNWIFLFLVSQMLTLQAEPSWYEQKLEGWYYFENPKETKKKKEETLTPERAKQILEAGKVQLEQLLAKAIISPTQENVETYMQRQKFWIEQNTKFANTWGRVLLHNPNLGDFITNPTTSYGINAKRELDLRNRKETLKELSQENFLLFVFKGEDPFSTQAAQVAQLFGETNKWKVQSLSLDGETLEQYPSPLIDHGLSKRIRFDAYPAFYIVNPYEDRVVPVGAGLISVTQLEQNVEEQCKKSAAPTGV